MPITTITERALFSRVARKLAHEGLTLHRCRYDSRWFNGLGRYYTVNALNSIDACFVQLEEWARDLKCLGPDDVVIYE